MPALAMAAVELWSAPNIQFLEIYSPIRGRLGLQFATSADLMPAKGQ
jgi:hypothetical protein